MKKTWQLDYADKQIHRDLSSSKTYLRHVIGDIAFHKKDDFYWNIVSSKIKEQMEYIEVVINALKNGEFDKK